MPDTIIKSERIAVLETEVKNLKKSVDEGFVGLGMEIRLFSNKFDELDKKYTTKTEFAPVKAIAYSIVGAAGLAVLGGLIALVVK